MRSLLRAGLLACSFMLFGFAAVQAHSHVRIVASSELIYAPDGSLTGIRHAWTFDDTFTSYALQDVDPRTKGVYSREDLAPLAETNALSLREFGFFTFTKADGKKVAFEDPVDYYLEYRDAALTLHFTLPFKTPVKARELAVEVFDPAGFNDFRFADQDPVRLVGAPPACRVSLQRARQDADAEEPDEQAVENDRSPGRGTGLANRIAVNCP